MKTAFVANGLSSTKRSGFALVVTLALMILLTIIAVGLLSLSGISLRSAGQGQLRAPRVPMRALG